MTELMTKLMGLPVMASEHGKDVDKLQFYVHFLMAALFVGWMAYFVYVLYRFRASKNPKADYVGARSHSSTYVEGAVALVEGVLLLGFAIPFWSQTVDKFPDAKTSTHIQIMAQQFAWNGRYPGADGEFGKGNPRFINSNNKFGVDPADPHGKDDVTPPVNTIAVPVDKPVICDITSMDVIHSFKIYPLRVNQDAIPGMSIPVHFVPNRVGKYQIVCAQLCGNSHYFMKGFFTVMKQDEYAKWLAAQPKASGGSGGGFD
jgi:cytochrome c oxidase subunit 2